MSTRDVNGVGRVRVIAPYPLDKYLSVPVPISVGYPLYGYLPIYFISTGTRFAKLFKK